MKALRQDPTKEQIVALQLMAWKPLVVEQAVVRLVRPWKLFVVALQGTVWKPQVVKQVVAERTHQTHQQEQKMAARAPRTLWQEQKTVGAAPRTLQQRQMPGATPRSPWMLDGFSRAASEHKWWLEWLFRAFSR